MYLDLVFEHSSGAQVTISPAGFGIYTDFDNPVGICLEPSFRVPSPIPGKADAEVCFDYTFTVKGSDVMVGFGFEKFEVCVEDNTFCADVVSVGAGFEFKVADVSDVHFLD
ncbi:hypothetical protein [Natrinema pallidum]|uniref:Uncharacterized protein n=1 Tax=Natrinema pallidum TaxID=69527 RepID=A0A4P9THW0_9EURY|nr:hypothetical protein [Natrinema pallidum]QCW03400.1 hypothetical protein FGF80_09170 [Natrinema pallidum]